MFLCRIHIIFHAFLIQLYLYIQIFSDTNIRLYYICIIFSCPQQLIRWPCHSVRHSLTVLLVLTLQSDPRDLWPLRHLFRVKRRHALTEKKPPTHLPTYLTFSQLLFNFPQLSLTFHQFFSQLFLNTFLNLFFNFSPTVPQLCLNFFSSFSQLLSTFLSTFSHLFLNFFSTVVNFFVNFFSAFFYTLNERS